MIWYYNTLDAVKAIGGLVKEDGYEIRRGLRLTEDHGGDEIRSEHS